MEEVSKDFRDFLIKQEADGGAKLSPYKDSNGHWTIGYGHKLGKDGDKHPRISEEIAARMLDSDIAKATKRAGTSIDNKFGDGTWAGMTVQQQEALTDIEFNVGSVTRNFPSLTEAIIKGDRLRIGKEFLRWHDHDGADDEWKALGQKGKSGAVKEPLHRRNKAWWERYGKPMTGIKYRDTKAVARLVDFFDENEIPTEDY